MGYAATGVAHAELRSTVREVYEASGALPKFTAEDLFTMGFTKTNLPQRMVELVKFACGSLANQRAIAASIQAEFEDMTHGIIMALVSIKHIEGVVLTGGCALNVLVNQKLH